MQFLDWQHHCVNSRVWPFRPLDALQFMQGDDSTYPAVLLHDEEAMPESVTNRAMINQV